LQVEHDTSRTRKTIALKEFTGRRISLYFPIIGPEETSESASHARIVINDTNQPKGHNQSPGENPARADAEYNAQIG
jgi:hypothetical protein